MTRATPGLRTFFPFWFSIQNELSLSLGNVASVDGGSVRWSADEKKDRCTGELEQDARADC